MAYCNHCGHELVEDARFCSTCGAEVLEYAQPAGFWIRVWAFFIDSLVFIPLGALEFLNLIVVKSLVLHILITTPGLLYKPLMEHYFGATLGKMACKIRVQDDMGNKLGIMAAYVRFLPFLFLSLISLIGMAMLFSHPDFLFATDYVQINELQKRNPLMTTEMLVSFFCIFECIFAGFTYRKRALHDMMAGSFCVYDYGGQIELTEQDWD
jgi:uncharacterized RDD family membrane protein YckC